MFFSSFFSKRKIRIKEKKNEKQKKKNIEFEFFIVSNLSIFITCFMTKLDFYQSFSNKKNRVGLFKK